MGNSTRSPQNDDGISIALAVNEALRIHAGGTYVAGEDDEYLRGYFDALETSTNLIRGLVHDPDKQASPQLGNLIMGEFAHIVGEEFKKPLGTFGG